MLILAKEDNETDEVRALRTGADDFVQIDHMQHEVEALGAKIVLTPTEFRMLAAFSRHAGQALTHRSCWNWFGEKASAIGAR